MANQNLESFLKSHRKSSSPPRKMALMHCPTFNLDTFKFEVLKNCGYYAYPPRGLQCLATVSMDLGFDVDIIDLNYLLLEKLHTLDPNSKPDLHQLLLQIVDDYTSAHDDTWIYGVSTGVIVSNIFSVDRHPYLEVLNRLISNPKRLVITGGAVATVEYKTILKRDYAHIVFKGEAEDRLRYLLSLAYDIPNIPETAGICFKLNGEIQESNGAFDMVDFQQSVIETYKKMPIENYHNVGCLSPFSRLAGTQKRYASLQLNRGCRMRCSFCGLSQYRGSNKVCQYPVNALIEELKYLVYERGIQHFEWLDEDLLANREAILEVMNRIAAEKIPVTWAANIGVIAVYLDEEILDAMARSNCLGFRIGVESGNEEMLKKIRKPLTKDRLRSVCDRLQNYKGIFVASCWIIGFPEERYGQMYDTLQFALELNLSWAQVTIFQDLQESDDDDANSNDVNRDGFDLSQKNQKKAERITDFIPSSEKVVGSSRKNEIYEGQLRAQEIFMFSPEQNHDPKLKDQFWFAFNLIINYATNKNLRPDGNIDHFIGWLKGLQMTYPHHALMSLFQSLAHTVKGDTQGAQKEWDLTLKLLSESEFWRMKFDLFQLNEIIEHRPRTSQEVCAQLDKIVEGYRLPFTLTS